MSESTSNRIERRSAQRFEVLTPVAIRFEGQTISAFTQNLSGRGIFLYAESAVPEATSVELTFAMPSEVTMGESMSVRCRGRVLRGSAPQPGHRHGIAIQLEAYEYLPADECLPVSHFVRVSVPSPSESSRPVSR